MTIVTISTDTITEIGPRDPSGASSWRSDEGACVFQGTPAAAAHFLRNVVPVGCSVTIRHPGGLRSCMNKPALWPWVEDLTSYTFPRTFAAGVQHPD